MFPQKNKKYVSRAEALTKLQRYCAYQERCHQEVRSKLLELGIYGDDLEDIIVALIEENFLNEERFARTYAGGKFRAKRWGKVRIEIELKQRHISPYCIQAAFTEIEADDYEKTLLYVLNKRLESLDAALSPFEKRYNATQYAMQRGFEIDLVQKLLETLL
jgi:regulatory protein